MTPKCTKKAPQSFPKGRQIPSASPVFLLRFSPAFSFASLLLSPYFGLPRLSFVASVLPPRFYLASPSHLPRISMLSSVLSRSSLASLLINPCFHVTPCLSSFLAYPWPHSCIYFFLLCLSSFQFKLARPLLLPCIFSASPTLLICFFVGFPLLLLSLYFSLSIVPSAVTRSRPREARPETDHLNN